MDFLSPIVTFITDARQKLTHRLMFALTCILSLLLLNDLFGFSYFYTTNRKVEQLTEINTMLKDSLLDNTTKSYLLQLRAKTIARKDVISHSILFFTSPAPAESRRIDTVFVTFQDGKRVYSETREFKGPEKSRAWHFVTINIFWLLLACALPFIPSLIDKKSLIGTFFTILFAELFLIAVMLIWNWLFDFIPVLWGNPIWNYIVNLLINVGLFGGIIYAEQKKNR